MARTTADKTVSDATTTTPLRKQYLEIKAHHRDAILLFRIGDFYEAFDGDAHLLARELDIVLTSKPMGKGARVPLAGIPHQSLDRHLATLISRGHRIAICEQLSDAPERGAKSKLIERNVVRIVTPGTILEPTLLASKANNYLAAWFQEGKRAGIAYADVSTGEFAATEIDADMTFVELARIAAAELLVPNAMKAKHDHEIANQAQAASVTRCDDEIFHVNSARKTLLEHFKTRTLAPFGFAGAPLAMRASGALIAYLRDTQNRAIEQLTRLARYDTENFMLLDPQTVRSLEVFDSYGEAASLLSILDRTRTPMGGRALRRWLRQPLLDRTEINRRQDHVAWFLAREKERDSTLR